jgi:hypothetical protein
MAVAKRVIPRARARRGGRGRWVGGVGRKGAPRLNKFFSALRLGEIFGVVHEHDHESSE